MTTTPTASDTETTARGWSERWSPLGGLVFVIGMIVLLAINPDSGDTVEEVIQAAEDEGRFFFLGVFGLVSIPLLLWFVSGLHARVRRLSSETAPALVLGGGTAFALLVFLSFTTFAAPLIDFPDEAAEATAAANTYLTIDDIAWVTLGGGGVSFALMAIAASVAALRSGAVPTWAGWLGAVVGLAAAATITFFGIFAWMAWILVVSIALLVRRA